MFILSMQILNINKLAETWIYAFFKVRKGKSVNDSCDYSSFFTIKSDKIL